MLKENNPPIIFSLKELKEDIISMKLNQDVILKLILREQQRALGNY